jgi:hypothetical protein
MGHTYSNMNVNNVINAEEDYSIEDNKLNQDDKKESQEELNKPEIIYSTDDVFVIRRNGIPVCYIHSTQDIDHIFDEYVDEVFHEYFIHLHLSMYFKDEIDIYDNKNPFLIRKVNIMRKSRNVLSFIDTIEESVCLEQISYYKPNKNEDSLKEE